MEKEDFKLRIKKIFNSSFFKLFLIFIVFLLVSAVSFRAGVDFGFRKSNFGRDWGDNYSRNFGMQKPDRMMSFADNMINQMPNPNGAIGKIIKIEEGSVVVMDEKDQTEKIILIDDDTEVRFMREKVEYNNLRIDDFIVVLGNPGAQGQIKARLIRLMPFPAEMPR